VTKQGRSDAFDVVARYLDAVWVGAHLVLDVHHVVGFVLAAEQGRSTAFDVAARSLGAVWVGAPVPVAPIHLQFTLITGPPDAHQSSVFFPVTVFKCGSKRILF
jgi:hypothetical protein